MAIKSSGLNDFQKLVSYNLLKNQFERSGLKHDSAYAKILDRIGLEEYLANKDYNKAIRFTKQATDIFRVQKPAVSVRLLIGSYINLAGFYKEAGLYDNALKYSDTVTRLAEKLSDVYTAANFRLDKCLFYFQIGEYQKCIEECSSCLGQYDTKAIEPMLPALYNRRAQAHFFLGNFPNALADADSAVRNAHVLNNDMEHATALITIALVNSKKSFRQQASADFLEAISFRLKTGDYLRIAEDYTDYGNFFAENGDYKNAHSCYRKTIEFAKKSGDQTLLSKAYINTGQVYFRQGDLKNCGDYYLKSFTQLGVSVPDGMLSEVGSKITSRISNKELLLVMMGNKTEFLLALFKSTGDREILSSAIRNSYATDTIITQLRHEQLNTVSKLYWRQKTREFYTNAVEACWLAQDASSAFYFFERSRAVLLNDRLNEIGAGLKLPLPEQIRQQELYVKTVMIQQQLSGLQENSAQWRHFEMQLVRIKDSLEQFIKSLELRYPGYYLYKYLDVVPSLNAAQQYLNKSNRQLLHYFSTDTALYCLSVSPSATRFLKIKDTAISGNNVKSLASLLSSANKLNLGYDLYAKLSWQLYHALFSNIKIDKASIVVCPDNYFIPFESLCTDVTGSHFLIQNLSFSYAYSASSLLRSYPLSNSMGNFLGMAPGKFSATLSVPQLGGSIKAIRQSASFFSHSVCLTGVEASRRNFIKTFPGYSVINIFSHASSDPFPRLYLQDSLINLNELDLVNNHSVQLVILSACETNAGKNYSGEGIFSMARGFSSIGIPSVAATLWKADENAIYEITSFFNEQLSKGINKDEALRAAKLQYIKNHHGERQLPFYWANLILIGDASPVLLSKTSPVNTSVAIILGIIVMLTIAFVVKKHIGFYKE